MVWIVLLFQHYLDRTIFTIKTDNGLEKFSTNVTSRADKRVSKHFRLSDFESDVLHRVKKRATEVIF